MAAFVNGDIDVLVATTVIEVGVDVPNASIMVIEHAERFGLSQLHQLRGRVGRGAAESTCVLLFEEPVGDVAKLRLKVIFENTDGFEIARQDLLIRGPGEFLGARQSGVPLLRFADLERDVALIEQARDAADELLAEGAGRRAGAPRALAGRAGGVHQGLTGRSLRPAIRAVGSSEQVCLPQIKVLGQICLARWARMAAARIAATMSLYALGLNHTTAPVEVRERVAFTPDALGDALRDLVGARAGEGSGDPVDLQPHRGLFPRRRPRAGRALARRTSTTCPQASLHPYVYTLPQDQAVTHAFRVASGLDSMVLGEPQILGQMKQAVRSAEAAGSLGLVLNRLFQRTFAVAKDVRTQTDIGSASISMAAAAVKLAERIFPSIADQRLLLIGAGEMIELAATHFVAKTPKSITVANRTFERGSQLADRLGARRDHAERASRPPAQFDIIVTCTASTLPILGKGTARARGQAAQARAGVHRRPRGAARRRAGGRGTRRRVPVQRRRPRGDREGQPAGPARSRWCRPSR